MHVSRQTGKEAGTMANIQTSRHTDKQEHTKITIQAGRQADKQTCTQAVRKKTATKQANR